MPSCCLVKLDASCPHVQPQQTRWFATGPTSSSALCSARREAWQRGRACPVQSRMKVVNSSDCMSPDRVEALKRAAHPFDPLVRHDMAYMMPASPSCATRQAPSEISAECERFSADIWEPWVRMPVHSDSCYAYETERSGIGNCTSRTLDPRHLRRRLVSCRPASLMAAC